MTDSHSLSRLIGAYNLDRVIQRHYHGVNQACCVWRSGAHRLGRPSSMVVSSFPLALSQKTPQNVLFGITLADTKERQRRRVRITRVYLWWRADGRSWTPCGLALLEQHKNIS